ncbi:MAG TPA: L,D-transpeptidase family protein [Lacipirellulaceae bacterium]|nr:L,D-transpeptidase family protein [Lacipirellulaceae bacterium]
MVRSLLIAVLAAVVLLAAVPATSRAEPAQQGWRMREVGGYGIVQYDTPTYEYGSLDSNVNGRARAGEIVYINGWQIGVYHVGDYRWVAAAAVQPIIDAWGRPITGNVTAQNGVYYMNGRALSLPARHRTQVERFLASPNVNARVLYNGSSVPSDEPAEIVDTSQVWHSSGERVVATMRVTDLYNFIYLRTAPSADAPQASYQAYAGEVLTAYEVQGNWYRIAAGVWAPRTWGDEVLMVPENVEAYAPPEYYNGRKWISIDLDRQRLTAWEGADVVISSPVKSGKYGYQTPAGVYRTYSKIPNERMSGNDYDLLDVAWTQYFNGAIAIHAAHWHNNYNGRPGSHGCVNTPEEKARALFMWAPLGTTVVAHNPYVFDSVDIANANKWSEYDRSR